MSTSNESLPITPIGEEAQFISKRSSPTMDRTVENIRAVNDQPQQVEANTTKITPEIMDLDSPQTNSASTITDQLTLGTQSNIDQRCNKGQTNSLLQPIHNESPNSNNSYTHNDFIATDQPSDPTQAPIQSAIEITQDTTSNQATPLHTTELSIVTKFAHGRVGGPKRGRLKRNQFYPLDWNLKRGE